MVAGRSMPSSRTPPTSGTGSTILTWRDSSVSIRAYTRHPANTDWSCVITSEGEPMASFALTIGGQPAVTRNTFNVLNPADESVVAECPEATLELVDQAVASARAAFKSWSNLPDEERVKKLLAIAD